MWFACKKHRQNCKNVEQFYEILFEQHPACYDTFPWKCKGVAQNRFNVSWHSGNTLARHVGGSWIKPQPSQSTLWEKRVGVGASTLALKPRLAAPTTKSGRKGTSGPRKMITSHPHKTTQKKRRTVSGWGGICICPKRSYITVLVLFISQ